ncbi:urease accessory protein UreD [Cohnella massiliensis]|uniref:urease accessory protein UreD n=1 Tax=Cohnella massiliensis TaxID=1816691 RepID=UPI0009BA61E5|nr:urease accessory protein UreD [Cohnella massiliensis]
MRPGEHAKLQVRSRLKARAELVRGKPALAESYHEAPLKIAKTFPLHDEAGPQLAVVHMDVSPGLMDGDRYAYDWRIGEGVRLYATNQAYTRVHPCPYDAAKVEQRFVLERDAVLEWLPEPVMLYRDAHYECVTEVDLSPGSICVIGEALAPGRISRGERFAFRCSDTKLAVRHNGELIHYQRQRLLPDKMSLAAPGSFGSYTHLASLYVFSDKIGPELADRLAGVMEESCPEGVVWSVARTAKLGVVAMLAGNRGWQLQRLLTLAWDETRRQLLSAPPLRLIGHA